MPTTSAPASGLASLTGKVVLGFFGTWVLALMAANLVPVIIAALVQDLGLDIAQAGAVASGMTIASAATMLVTTRFVAGVDRPRLGRIGLVAMIIGYGLAAVVLTTPVVLGGLILGGVGTGIMIATGTAAASSTRNPDGTVATITIINRLAATALLAIAPLFHNDLRTVLLVVAGLGVVGLLLAGGLPNLPEEQRLAAHDRSVPVAALTGVAILLALSTGFWSLTEDMVYSMTSVLAERSGTSPELAGTLLAGKVFGGLIGAVLAPVALKFIGRSWSLLIIVVISTATKFAMIMSASVTVYATSILIWGVMYGAVLVLITGLAAVMDVTGRTGVLVFGVYLGGVALGPLVGGQLVGLLTPLQYALVVTVPSVIFGASIFIIARSRRKFESGNTTAIDLGAEPAATR